MSGEYVDSDRLRKIAGSTNDKAKTNALVNAAREIDRLRALSAHGQQVVDEAAVLLACAAYHGERWPGADSPFERHRMRAALIAALTGDTT